jgi:hypothetical protein
MLHLQSQCEVLLLKIGGEQVCKELVATGELRLDHVTRFVGDYFHTLIIFFGNLNGFVEETKDTKELTAFFLDEGDK